MKKKILWATLVLFAILLIATNAKAATVSNWDELRDAIKGTDEEIKLLNDITETTEASETAISVAGNKVLNLNGKTLKLSNAYFVITGNAKLTIDGNGAVISNVRKTFDCYTGGTLNIKSGTFKNTHSDSKSNMCGRVIGAWGTETDTGVATKINIEKGVKLISDYGYGIAVFEDSKKGSYNLTINTAATIESKQMAITINGNVKETTGKVPSINIKAGSYLKSEEVAIYGAGYGKWTIEDGTEFVGEEALTIKAGEFNINGGSFKANGTFVQNPVEKGSGAEDTGNAINIISHSDYAGKILVNILGKVNVESKNGYAIYEDTLKGTNSAVKLVEIYDGTYTGKVGAVKSKNLEQFIVAGNFSDELEEKYVSDGSKVADVNGRKYYGLPYEITIDEDSKNIISVSKTTAIPGEKIEVKVNEDEIKDKYEVKGLIIISNGENKTEIKGTSFEMPESDITIKAVLKEVVKTTEQAEEAEKDNTPKTGTLNIALYALATIGTVAFVGVLKTKNSKH